MIRIFIYLLLTAFGGALLFASFAFCLPEDEVRFVVPPNWPQPVYNFASNPLNANAFKLGRSLFFDPVLSRDSTVSCVSCHLQFTGFTHVDHSLSHGVNGLKGTRNSLTLFNLAWNTSFMWDGGVNNLEVQPLNPITSSVEMASSLKDIVARLNKSVRYKRLFYLAYNDSAITGQKVLKALAQFTVMLESYNSKYDKYMRKEPGGEMSEAELNGLAIYRRKCSSCHSEPLFTNNGFENNGLVPDTALMDIGRAKITGARVDYFKFRVPTLRNVAVSHPYMHDGRFRNLRQVLDHYSEGIKQSETLARQLKNGIPLTEEEKEDLTLFLQTLTDRDFLFDLRFRNYFD